MSSNSILSISNIRVRDVEHTIKIRGHVLSIKQHRPYFKNAAFKCVYCGSLSYVSQDTFLVLDEPICCEEETCGRNLFKINYSKSEMGDMQEFIISDYANILKAFIFDDLVNTISEGHDYIFTGKLIYICSQPLQKTEYGFLVTEIKQPPTSRKN